MEITKASVAALTALSLVAGATGAYLVTHQVAVPTEETTLASTRTGQIEAETPTPEAAPSSTPTPVERATSPAVTRRVTAPRPVEPPSRVVTPGTATPRPQLATEGVPTPTPVTPVQPPTIPQPEAPAPVEPIRSNETPVPVVPAPPSGPLYDELVVAAESVVGLEVETALSSERARVEDAVVARVARDVKVADRVAIPAGSKVHGEVSLVERGGRLRERARLGVRFTSIVTPDGTRHRIHTDTVYREGSSPDVESAAKIGGGGVVGAIIGGILGGSKGAAIGGTVGAGAGTAAVLTGNRNPAVLAPGTPVTVRLQEPVVITVER